MKISCQNPEQVVKKAFFLAWEACGGPLGMGIFQDRANVTMEDVWKNVQTNGDYPGGPIRRDGSAYGDYVFGRMMKLNIRYGEDFVEVDDYKPKPDYQAWSRKYKTYQELIEAAIK